MSADDLVGITGEPLDFIERATLDEVDETKWAPLLAEFVQVLEALNRRKGMTEDAAFNDARDAVLGLASHLGGRMVYLPRGDRLRVALRDAGMWREFRGNNVEELAMQHGISTIHAYHVLKCQRALHQRKLQGRLFAD